MNIRPSILSDIPSLVQLSYIKRRQYEKAQPQFWKYVESAEETQAKWFEELLNRDDYICLTALSDDNIVGFVIGRLVKAPEVYNPGGLTLMIDDFCVSDSNWQGIGKPLIDEIKKLGKAKGAAQIIVVCGHADQPKRSFLKSIGLDIASEWNVGEI